MNRRRGPVVVGLGGSIGVAAAVAASIGASARTYAGPMDPAPYPGAQDPSGVPQARSRKGSGKLPAPPRPRGRWPR